jgi:hypothetical protein
LEKEALVSRGPAVKNGTDDACSWMDEPLESTADQTGRPKKRGRASKARAKGKARAATAAAKRKPTVIDPEV